MTSVAIMQPTYLPWMGYFALMDRVDQFVLLDCVQFERASWQQRNRIKGPTGEQMLTVPVFKKGLREQLISDVRINAEAGFPESHIRAIDNCYARAEFRDAYFPPLRAILSRSHEKLMALTIELIGWLADALGISTPRVVAGSLGAGGRKADLLADICGRLGADTYVSPPGAQNYMERNEAFDRAGIRVVTHSFEHPRYTQLHGDFVPQLSVIDLLFNEGPGSSAILRSGLR
ncbi:MAG: WbqC family protein [Pseudomonadota bacterium]|nr:WbqC family protein [Pseudomonadota bacterium]